MSTKGWLISLTALACWLVVPCFADSQARIVRLSQVDGDVQIDRNAGQGFEKGFPNLPVVEGAKLQAGEAGRAEVEFEDGSALRITPGTVMEFPTLGRDSSGATVSNVVLRQGTAYLDFRGDTNAPLTLTFAREKLVLTRSAHLRVQLRDAEATVAVFKGEVAVEGDSGTLTLEKKHSATFDLGAQGRYTLANNLESDPYDEWDKQQGKYHDQYKSSAFSSPYGYGISDLNYYGGFYSIPGYGMMWQPYLVGAGWDPFMNGAWMWYPGYGYTWISAYPWGWTPYRYGSWFYVPSYGGWFWQPGSTWAGWNTGPRIFNAPSTFSVPRPPSRPGQTLIVSRAVMPGSAVDTQNRLPVRSGSAGLGITRGSVRNLGKISQQVEASQPRSAGQTGWGRSPSASGSSSHPSNSRTVSAPRSAPSSSSPRMSAPSRSGPSASSPPR